MDGGVLGLGAGSTISGYEIAGIGHGVHMRLVTYPIRLVSYWAGCGSCAASAVFQRKIYALDALCLAAPPQVTAALKVRVEALQAGVAKVEESAAGQLIDVVKRRRKAIDQKRCSLPCAE
jgi:hypothetical protein